MRLKVFDTNKTAAKVLGKLILVFDSNKIAAKVLGKLILVFDSNKTAAKVLGKLILGTSMLTTINSDDPAYFGGYLLENYIWIAEMLDLDANQVAQLAKNSFFASFINPERRESYFRQIDDAVANYLDADDEIDDAVANYLDVDDEVAP
eukprot:gene24256-9856_t